MTKQINGLKNDFKLCPQCGSTKIENHYNRKWICPDCGYDLYNNVAAAVGVIIYDKYDNVLFEVRAKEPRKGCLTVPGGFVDFDESLEQAVERECREEIGVPVTNARYLCSAPNTYDYRGVEYKTCDTFFTVELPSQYDSMVDFIKTLKPEATEVVNFEACRVSNLDDVEVLPLAFESARYTLLRWLNVKYGG